MHRQWIEGGRQDDVRISCFGQGFHPTRPCGSALLCGDLLPLDLADVVWNGGEALNCALDGVGRPFCIRRRAGMPERAFPLRLGEGIRGFVILIKREQSVIA
jgi:hypothetical protein